MNVVWRKIWRDLWRNKLRTFLVVLATAVGVFALGFVYGTSGMLRTRLTESYQATVPAHLTFYTSLFQEQVVDTIRHEPGVADAQGEIVTSVRWKLEGDKNWRDGYVVARPDYNAQRVALFQLVQGRWPEPASNKRGLAIERLSSRYWKIPVGGQVIIEVGRYERNLPIEDFSSSAEAIAGGA